MRIKRTFEEIKKKALRYETRGAFRSGDYACYQFAKKNKILDQVCVHMPKRVDRSGKNNPNYKYTNETLKEIALKYESRGDFKKNNSVAYNASLKRGILEEICRHMKRMIVSTPEKTILKEIQKYFPEAKKNRANRLKIFGKPYIKTLEIDIYIPQLRKGIEFDGTYHHSLEGLKRGHPTWPIKDLERYHEIKDDAFLSLGIQILHIKENDWNLNKELCIQKCLVFLGG